MTKVFVVFFSILVFTFALSTSDDISEWKLFKVNTKCFEYYIYLKNRNSGKIHRRETKKKLKISFLFRKKNNVQLKTKNFNCNFNS